MTPDELFHRLAPLVAPRIEEQFGRRDLCIFATRIVIDVGAYFRIEVEPLPVQTILCNAAFAKHVDEGDIDVRKHAADGSWSVGIGFGADPDPVGKWNGHLVAVADGYFGDYSIGQAERTERNIFTGHAIVGPLAATEAWQCENDHGTRIAYRRIDNDGYLTAPDWIDRKRRTKLVAKLIRAVR